MFSTEFRSLGKKLFITKQLIEIYFDSADMIISILKGRRRILALLNIIFRAIA